MDYFSWLVYGIFMVIACALAYKTERKNYDPVWLGITYLFVVVFWGIRYKIGFDYVGYMEIFEALKYSTWPLVEPGYKVINWIFVSSEIGYVWVMFTMAALSYFFLFKVFVREKIFLYGIFFSLAFQFQFMLASQMRQALVISAFLYALHFIEVRKYWRYALFMAFMMLFHYTAGFMIAALIMARIKIPSWGWLCMIIGAYGLLLSGVSGMLGNKLLMALPFYQLYLSSDNSTMTTALEEGFSIVLFFWVVVALYLLLYRKTINRPELFNIYMIGIVLYIVFVEFHLLNRMLRYFTLINIILASILCRNNFRQGILLLIISFLAFNLLTLKIPNYYGIQPYQTIFEQKVERYK